MTPPRPRPLKRLVHTGRNGCRRTPGCVLVHGHTRGCIVEQAR